MSFNSLLIHSCDIQAKSLNRTGYEKTESWTEIAENVPCRHDSSSNVKINDGNIRVNSDDDVFFFKPDVQIERGNRIVHDGVSFDVIKVGKLYNATTLHHLEVIARATDHN